MSLTEIILLIICIYLLIINWANKKCFKAMKLYLQDINALPNEETIKKYSSKVVKQMLRKGN